MNGGNTRKAEPVASSADYFLFYNLAIKDQLFEGVGLSILESSCFGMFAAL